MKIKFPLMILGYSPKRVFSTEDENGYVCFPVFFDPEKAEAYRVFFAREYHQALDVYVIEEVKNAHQFFQALSIADPGLQQIAIDPPPPVDGKRGKHSVQYQDFLEDLQSRQAKNVKRRHARSPARRRTAGNGRPTRTRKG